MLSSLLLAWTVATLPTDGSLKAGESRAVAGTPVAERTFADGTWRAGPCAIPTPLPAGYPAPTVPGAIELKAYPAIRKAQATAGFGPEIGRNLAFWKLFRHIERNEIAMTSPVEMKLETEVSATPASGGATDGKDGKNAAEAKQGPAATAAATTAPRLAGWSMAFLYREPTMGRIGVDGDVEVVEEAPLTVLSIGVRGDYSSERALAEAEQLRARLADLPGWRVVGSPRALYYNGPEMRSADRWGEIQLIVEPVPVEIAPPASPAPPATTKRKRRAI